ncbi:MAG: N-acetylglucosamine-6-phosphate deacetylase [Acidobacteriota bacterium]|nr:N-acetylglucosamine-6-phosphate deacetylase [Acidobacteriota bacterium]
MNCLLLKNAAAILPDKTSGNISILLKDTKLAEVVLKDKAIGADKVIDLEGAMLCAGFIDVHNHGAVGIDVNTATAEDLRKVSRFLATKGVTGWLPTFVPDATENYRKVIDAIDEAMRTRDEREPAARILGVHYEGVFANEKMCGALRPEFFKTFRNGDELNDLPTLKTPGAIHLTTLAPEIENGIALVRELKKRNWIVSIGHTRAGVETLDKAFEAGASHVTHLFNAMTGVHHRDLGVAGWALTTDEVYCEIIADGVHVAAPMLSLAYKNKTAEKLALVSDSVAPTGLGDGDFQLWNEKITVANGKTQNERGSIAGSVITMLDAVKMMLSLGIAPEEVSKMASFVPAKVLGIENQTGSIETGKRADLVALDKAGRVKLTIVGGRIAFKDM